MELHIQIVPMIDPIKSIAKVANKISLKEITKCQPINVKYEVIKKGYWQVKILWDLQAQSYALLAFTQV